MIAVSAFEGTSTFPEFRKRGNVGGYLSRALTAEATFTKRESNGSKVTGQIFCCKLPVKTFLRRFLHDEILVAGNDGLALDCQQKI
jgi:hypothetical protein